MNNGFNGTGTAFILYIILAFCMPFIYVYRLMKHRRDFNRRFVLGHFWLGLTVTVVAIICVGYLWSALAINKHSYLHNVLVAMAYLALLTILTWVLIPRLVRTNYRLRRKKALLYYKNPLIRPWQLPPQYKHAPGLELKHLAKYGDLPSGQWLDFTKPRHPKTHSRRYVLIQYK